MNAVYHEKSLMFIGATFREKLISHHQAVNINCLNTFEFIKVVSDTVFDMINTLSYFIMSNTLLILG